MPFGKKRVGSKWVVYNKASGRVLGTHDTKEKANKQLAALAANVPEAKHDRNA